MTTKAPSRGLAGIAQPAEDVAQALARGWNAGLSQLEALVRALRIEKGARHRLIPASEATHERFAREEDYPAVMLTATQSEELRQIEQPLRSQARPRARARKPRRAAKA
jgi:hypothetical protein